MTENKLIYKDINKWAQRPGVVATATVLLNTEPNGEFEVDIHSKEEAIKITTDLINTLIMWITRHEELLSIVPNVIREYLWYSDDAGFIYNNTTEELKRLREEHNQLLLSYYPARSIINNLNQMRKDRNKYESLFIYFNSL